MTGYDALHDGAAWVQLAGRGKIRVSGEDRARLLHAMTTNHIQQLAPGQGCYAFFLNAQGRILADANIFCREEDFLLDTEPETAVKIYEHIDHYVIADDVALENLPLTTIALEGPRAEEVLRAAGGPVPKAEYEHEPWGVRTVARVSSTGAPGFFVFLASVECDELLPGLEAAGAVAATAEEFRTVRIENGRPRYGEDISERYIAQEANQPRALHFSKGCYLGQEIVERVRSRAQIHRVLMPLVIDTTEPPEPGTKLQAGGADRAEITSAALSRRSGKVVALAYVRTELAKPGSQLDLGGARAEVVQAAAAA
ncbi:MAG TPA: glycine cleavage T C-terminal barrel domain-containing protein [Bryobacteraceae bacterium]|nr:glycine cleavage T C-terminal barrel domain-containing protein [Bryobacteraceae bacterium]